MNGEGNVVFWHQISRVFILISVYIRGLSEKASMFGLDFALHMHDLLSHPTFSARFSFWQQSTAIVPCFSSYLFRFFFIHSLKQMLLAKETFQMVQIKTKCLSWHRLIFITDGSKTTQRHIITCWHHNKTETIQTYSICFDFNEDFYSFR